MSTLRQIEANRRNAQKSTGPPLCHRQSRSHTHPARRTRPAGPPAADSTPFTQSYFTPNWLRSVDPHSRPPPPPVPPPPPALHPPTLPPSPKATSPQIGFVPSTPIPAPPQPAPAAPDPGAARRLSVPLPLPCALRFATLASKRIVH